MTDMKELKSWTQKGSDFKLRTEKARERMRAKTPEQLQAEVDALVGRVAALEKEKQMMSENIQEYASMIPLHFHGMTDAGKEHAMHCINQIRGWCNSSGHSEMSLVEQNKKLVEMLENFVDANDMIAGGMNVHGGMPMMIGTQGMAKRLLSEIKGE